MAILRSPSASSAEALSGSSTPRYIRRPPAGRPGLDGGAAAGMAAVGTAAETGEGAELHIGLVEAGAGASPMTTAGVALAALGWQG